MEKFAITFRDFTAHLIPGLIYIIVFFYSFPEYLTIFEGREVLFSVVGIFAAYAVGFLADTIIFPKFNKILRLIPLFKDPIANYYNNVSIENVKSLKSLSLKMLYEHLGKEIASNTKFTALVYTCIRYIEIHNSNVGNILARINSLGNLAIAMAPPLLLFAITSAIKQSYILTIIGIVMAYFSIRKNLFYRTWLARSATRYYILLRKDELK